MRRGRFPKYDGGYCDIYEEAAAYNTFGAKLNDSTLTAVYTDVPFEKMSEREQDVEFANANDFTLSMKISITYTSGISKRKSYKVMIGTERYKVYDMDFNSEKIFMYLEFEKEVSEDDD